MLLSGEWQHLSLSQLQGNHPLSLGQTLACGCAFQEGGVLSRFGQVLCSPSLKHCLHGDLISWSLTPTSCPVHHQHLYLSAHPISPRCLVSFIRSGLLPCTPAIISSVCLQRSPVRLPFLGWPVLFDTTCSTWCVITLLQLLHPRSASANKESLINILISILCNI